MKDLTWVIGMTFNDLKIIEEIADVQVGGRVFLTECVCGNSHIASWNNISRNMSKRCAKCSNDSRRNSQLRFNTRDNIKEYRSYRAMLERCTNKNHPSFCRYGGAGINVCSEWLDKDTGFLRFLESLGKRPEGYTLDRIDNNLGYSPENCRWASLSEQGHNKSKRRDAETSSYIGVSKDKKTWVMQFMVDKVKTREPYRTEVEAAIAYDNLSELHFGDRPNGTEQAIVEVAKRKRGGISIKNGGKSFVVRITGLDGVRRQVGRYKTREEAETALDEALKDM